ncbi:MAG: DNA alkylation repair protein [Candidatus Gribaldobacteria bacterium]|nr:DNA alkylation repair protein [Candidatus Gribaldobacteria bacterium]
MNCQEIIKKLKTQSNAKNVAGMARFGINPKNNLGVSMPALRMMAKEIGKDHKVALELWQTEIHEARILAGLIDAPEMVTKKQMDAWAGGFDSWDVCDQVCMNLFDKILFAFDKAKEYAQKDKEFVKRTGFALMASLAVHNKKAKDSQFAEFFPFIIKASTDERNFVKKAVNWALRQIGKRNMALNKQAIKIAKEIQAIDNKTAQWIANDTLRELSSQAIQKRIK